MESKAERNYRGNLRVLYDNSLHRHTFRLGIKQTDHVEIIFSGKFNDNGDAFAAMGLALEKMNEGVDVFYIFHLKDIQNYPNLIGVD